MNNNNFDLVVEAVNREIINTSLLRQGDEPILSIEVHRYIEECLTEEDKLACLHYNRGHVQQLMLCNPESIMVARQAIPTMMNLLHNNFFYFILLYT